MLSPATGARHGFSATGLQALENTLAVDVAAGRLPGAVVALWYAGEPAWSCAVGWLDAEQSLPMRTDAIFRIYSMTKPFTSVAALRLVQRGVLALDDAVARHLPGFGHRGVTVRHLLMHTAGLTYGPRLPAGALREAYVRAGLAVNPRQMNAAQLVAALSQVPLTAAPGTQWDYGNATDLLGVLVEAVSGQRLGEHLREQLFEPLGMHDTGFTLAAGAAHRLAQPLPRDPVDGSALNVPDQTFDPLEAPRLDSGGAGALSTAADYGRFANFLLARGRVGHRSLLDGALFDEMVSDQLGPRGVRADPSPGESAVQSAGYGFGLGFAVRLAGEAGAAANLPGSAGSFFWSGTAGTLFWVDPAQRLTAVYMSQAPGASRQHYRRLVMQLVYAALER